MLFTVLGFTASENVSVTVVFGPSPVEPFDGVTVWTIGPVTSGVLAVVYCANWLGSGSPAMSRIELLEFVNH